MEGKGGRSESSQERLEQLRELRGLLGESFVGVVLISSASVLPFFLFLMDKINARNWPVPVGIFALVLGFFWTIRRYLNGKIHEERHRRLQDGADEKNILTVGREEGKKEEYKKAA